jgi:hypothetical protein
MRKSAKRGEPQIFLLCVTLWASAGSVVSARAFAVPSPAASAENKSAPPWPRHIGRGVGAFLFPQGKARYAERGRKKTFSRALFFLGRTGRPPFLERKGGDEGEERASPVLHPCSTTQRLLSEKTARMGDKAKPLVSWAGGFAV